MLLLLALSTAHAFPTYDVDALMARLDEVESLRSMSQVKDPPSIPEWAYRQSAEKGQVVSGLVDVPGYSAKKAWAVGIMDVNVKRLWAGLNDELNHTGLTPVTHCEIASGSLCADKRHVLMYLPVPLFSDRWWIVENSFNPQLTAASGGTIYELKWKHIPNPETHPMSDKAKELAEDAVTVAFSIGSWLIIALDDDHTLCEYNVWTDPGGNVPAGPATRLATGGLDQTFQAMLDYAKRDQLQCYDILF